jgi:predicted metalloprotease with PDZ domain
VLKGLPLNRRVIGEVLFVLGLFGAGSASLAESKIVYTCDATKPTNHFFHVTIRTSSDGASAVDFQMPAWNALYQIRDFAYRVRMVQAFNQDGVRLPVEKEDKQTWRVSTQASAQVVLEYDVYANELSPYSAQLDESHAFINGAYLLMYPVGQRDRPIQVHFVIPQQWRIATELSSSGSENTFEARNYDHLTDSPIEMGNFRWLQFETSGVQFAVAIDGESAQFDEQELLTMLERIVLAEFNLMQDVPLKHYTFIYHFAGNASGGGMEHAYSTAIQVNAGEVSERLESLAGVSAHEFFHLWNVKRIRPSSLEPVDYTRENVTRALWFSEGVTSLYSEYVLVRSGVGSKKEFYKLLAETIESEQQRPAHLLQSAEESSIDTWFDKYPFYRRPENSISYYEKGEVIGLLLDLTIRQATQNQKSLDDVMRYLNIEYAKKGKFFDERRGIPDVVEKVTGRRFDDFFDRYVGGTEEIDFSEFLVFAGLKLDIQSRRVADLGFTVTENFDQIPRVDEVTSGSGAEKAGVRRGDGLLKINGRPATRSSIARMSKLEPRKALQLQLSRNGQVVNITVLTGSKEVPDYQIAEISNPTALQMAILKGLLTGR